MNDLKFTGYNLPYINQELLKLDKSKAYRITVQEWQKRSISSNNQIHLWFGEIAEFYGDRTALDVKNFCKRQFGLSILLRSPVHSDKIAFLLDKLDYHNHSFESQMKLVQCLDVTSLFKTSEMKKFMEDMIIYWNDLGVPIKHKDK